MTGPLKPQLPLQKTSHKPRRPTYSPSPKETTYTTRPLPYTYLHLTLTSPPKTNPTPRSPHRPESDLEPADLDILTAHSALHSALSRFLGLHGAAISVDILHVAARTDGGGGDEFWIRVPREDGDKVVAAVAGWMGREGQVLRVEGRGDWLGGLVGRDAWQ